MDITMTQIGLVLGIAFTIAALGFFFGKGKRYWQYHSAGHAWAQDCLFRHHWDGGSPAEKIKDVRKWDGFRAARGFRSGVYTAINTRRHR